MLGKNIIHLIIFKILVSFITQVLSNKTKYSPNENAQENDSSNTEKQCQEKAGSTSTSSPSVEE